MLCGTTESVAVEIHYQQTRIPRMTRGPNESGEGTGNAAD